MLEVPHFLVRSLANGILTLPAFQPAVGDLNDVPLTARKSVE